MKNRMGGFEKNNPLEQGIGMDGPKNKIGKNKEMYKGPIITVVNFRVDEGFGPSGGVGRDTLGKEQDVYQAVSNEPYPNADFFGSRFGI